MDTKREKLVLLNTVDRFFGTSHGQVKGEGPSIFFELQKLGVLLCGGAILSIFTRSKVADLDFYCSYENHDQVETLLLKYFHKTFESSNAITFERKVGNKKYVVQLITRFTGEPEDIFKFFDFTITNASYDFRTGTFNFGDRFFVDTAARRLVYSGDSLYPICAMYRTKKYQEKGYYLSGATLMHITLSIVQLRITNYGDLKDQLMGIDTMYLQKLLNTKDPQNKVDYGQFIDEAFKVINSLGQTEAEVEENEVL